LRRAHQVVFDLKPGEVSALIEEADEGYYIYKMLSKEIPSFEAVKDEVGMTLQKHRMDSWMKNITGPARTKLNEQYLGSATVGSGEGQ
jgi:parvulin-like peptidyl-prolyl isomerase